MHIWDFRFVYLAYFCTVHSSWACKHSGPRIAKATPKLVTPLITIN